MWLSKRWPDGSIIRPTYSATRLPPLESATLRMHRAIDSGWHWLREIYEALVAHGRDNPVTEWVAPIASIILAAAAVFVAVMSWRTARRWERRSEWTTMP